MSHIIMETEPGSIAEELELLPGDELLDINGQPIVDILDYRFLCREEFLKLHIRRGDEEGIFEVEKDEDEDLGLVFENGLMDSYRTCRNRCLFCFIDQMPKGMRDTLYFKDDDARLSFLQGNYITLTNLSDEDVERIIRYRLEPINISVQAADRQLRCEMLRNKKAGQSLEKLQTLYEAGIHMNAQIVLCPGINDGAQLEYTLEYLSKFAPVMESVSVVPVGLTKYREGLYPLEPVSKELAEQVIDTVEAFQRRLFENCGLHFVHASDEFYLQTGRPLPEEDSYDGYLQLENGVGMVRLLREEFFAALSEESVSAKEGELSIATGLLGAECLSPLLAAFNRVFPNISVQLYPVRNDFFGEKITVSGLVTGGDLIGQLSGKPLGSRLLIPTNMLKSGEDVFLDDVTKLAVQERLGAPVVRVGETGGDLLDALLGRSGGGNPEYSPYEL